MQDGMSSFVQKPNWRRYDEMESRLSEHVSERMLDLIELSPGMRVLDIACGRGEPSLLAAKRVGEEGYVLAIDTDEDSLSLAQKKSSFSNLHFIREDVETHFTAKRSFEAEPSFHAATCRWGLMYMNQPVIALREIKRLLIPGGMFVAAFWAEEERVSWAGIPHQALAQVVDVESMKVGMPRAFRFADLEAIEELFEHAGLDILRVEEISTDVVEAASADEIADWADAIGLAGQLSGTQNQRWRDALCSRLYCDENGRFALGGVSRVVVGKVS